MIDNLPLNVEINQVCERNWGYYNEYKIRNSKDDLLAIFYDEKIAHTFVKIMNAFV